MCSRQIIFLAATASKAWEPLSVAVAGDVSYVFATQCGEIFHAGVCTCTEPGGARQSSLSSSLLVTTS